MTRMNLKPFKGSSWRRTFDSSYRLKLVLPDTEAFLPSAPRPIELKSPELPDCVLFFGTDNIPLPEKKF